MVWCSVGVCGRYGAYRRGMGSRIFYRGESGDGMMASLGRYVSYRRFEHSFLPAKTPLTDSGTGKRTVGLWSSFEGLGPPEEVMLQAERCIELSQMCVPWISSGSCSPVCHDRTGQERKQPAVMCGSSVGCLPERGSSVRVPARFRSVFSFGMGAVPLRPAR